MDDLINGSISENTTDPQPEEPDTEGGESDVEENQEDIGGGESSGDGSEESGGSDETGGTENPGSAPPDSESDPAGEVLGGTDSPTGVGVTPDDFRQAVDGLNAAADRLADGAPDYGDLLESVRSLVDIMAEQAQALQSNTIPISGYRDYDYPITVTWAVSPSAPNAPSGIESVESFDTPEAFEARYDEMCSLVGVSLRSFRILRISDCSELDYVYDVDSMPEEPETPEEPEEPDTSQEDILAALLTLHDDLQEISASGLEYHEQYIGLQEQYAEMQELNTDLQYHMLATNIAIGFALLLTLGYTVSHGFLQRMRVG